MRPRGEIRRALGEAGWELARERQRGFNWRELAERACVGFKAAHVAVKDMQRAGELAKVGTTRVPGCCRPVNLYVPAASRDACTGGELDTVLRAWAGAR